jgi:hypothetical protein
MGESKLRSIETRYAGCRFRSRIEARWAVFLDELGVTWEYEAEGVELPSGTRYLPDFWLPEQDAWLEIKGKEPSAAEKAKVLELAYVGSQDGYRVRVLTGNIPRECGTAQPLMQWVIPEKCFGLGGTAADFRELERSTGVTVPRAALLGCDGAVELYLFQGDVSALPPFKSQFQVLPPGAEIDVEDLGKPAEKVPGVPFMMPMPNLLAAADRLVSGEAEIVKRGSTTQYKDTPLEHWEFQKGIWIPGASVPEIEAAFNRARAARFEFGESG